MLANHCLKFQFFKKLHKRIICLLHRIWLLHKPVQITANNSRIREVLKQMWVMLGMEGLNQVLVCVPSAFYFRSWVRRRALSNNCSNESQIIGIPYWFLKFLLGFLFVCFHWSDIRCTDFPLISWCGILDLDLL